MGLTYHLVVDGAINGDLFLGWVRHQQVPTLQPGDVLVLENLGVHEMASVGEAIATAGTQAIHLPEYSQDLNPIELVFSKFKWLLKSPSAWTVEMLRSACGDWLDRFRRQTVIIASSSAAIATFRQHAI